MAIQDALDRETPIQHFFETGEVTHTQVAEWLETSLERLRRMGWIQGKAINTRGEMCMMGAVQQLSLTESHVYDVRTICAEVALTNRLRALGYMGDIACWNDFPRRTFKEVDTLWLDAIDAERKAAAEAGEL
jgi:hypothetical protein